MRTAPTGDTADRHNMVRDRGDTMVMTTVLVVFLVTAAWALLSASQQWGARRDVQAATAAASRAAAQVTPAETRGGVSIDPYLAQGRANEVLAASGYTGSVTINGLTVTVTATGEVDYAFPAPGFPTSLTASATATASRGVTGIEGG